MLKVTKKARVAAVLAGTMALGTVFAMPVTAGGGAVNKHWDRPGPMSPVLHPGSVKGAGMVQAPLDSIDGAIGQSIADRTFPGAVVFVARNGHVVKHEAYGHSALYTDDRLTEMDEPVAMTEETIFDLASISKIFTTTAAMKLYEQGLFSLDDPVAAYIPEFADNGKEDVTIRQLMTHTSGFTSWVPLYSQGETREDRLDIAHRYPLANPPGTKYTYSDLNMITLGSLVERLSGKRLDQFIKDEITGPLGMKDTMYNPPAELQHRIAATEYQPALGRGIVWGSVHDENAWSLDGVAGHAGVFSTASDLAKFAHMFLNDGRYGGKRILKPETVRLLEENQIPGFPGNDHGLGWELNQGWYMDALADSGTAGHTGYTGTSIAVSKKNQTIAILLTNRVHPSRNTISLNTIRRTVARHVADAIPAPLPKHDDMWFSGYGDQLDRTLGFQLNDEAAELSFDSWHRLEDGSDFGRVEVSADGVSWTELASLTGNGGDMERVTAELPEGTEFVRFRYDTDVSVNGRGWYVGNVLADGEAVEPAGHTEGWALRDH
ncbi:serine hydrolase [Bhargavaea ginsengi]|uniref:serine hydrolase domain-containing protein n=1 Tax=Bhargavaea ginsengi TaxID=426757 RepID=UPI003C747F10